MCVWMVMVQVYYIFFITWKQKIKRCPTPVSVSCISPVLYISRIVYLPYCMPPSHIPPSRFFVHYTPPVPRFIHTLH